MKNTCAVTCTGGRPELFALCRKWVERSSPHMWIVATDIDETPDLPRWATHIRLAPHDPSSRDLSAYRSLSRALLHVPSGFDVVIMEDDDWYPPDYFDKKIHHVRNIRAPLSGCSFELQYNLPASLYFAVQPQVAGAGCVAIKSDYVERYAKALINIHGADNAAYKALGGEMTDDTFRVAIKGVGFGLPGRHGASEKHDPSSPRLSRWKADNNRSMLSRVLGEDANEYLKLLLGRTTRRLDPQEPRT